MARVSSWRTRSLEMPSSRPSASRVGTRSFMYLLRMMKASRGPRRPSARSISDCQNFRSLASAAWVSGSGASSASWSSQLSLRSDGLSARATGRSSDWSRPEARRTVASTSLSGRPKRWASAWQASSVKASAPSFRSAIIRRTRKKSAFCVAVVPTRTSDQERTTWSWIEARIHHIA